MRVLWFSNSPGNSSEFLGDSFVGSSWISSLDKAIQGKVDLHLAFYYPKKSDSYRYRGATYHPIGKKNWKLNALKDILCNRLIDKQDLVRYLEIINEVKPDIIHIHGTENPFGCIIQQTDIPIVLSVQGCLTVIEHKYCGGFSKKDLHSKYSSSRLNIQRLIFSRSFLKTKQRMKLRSLIERETLTSLKYVIGRTDWDKRLMSLFAPLAKYYYCSEIMREGFYKKKWYPHIRNMYIIHSTLGNTPYKGFDLVCLALYELRLGGLNIVWQIAGLSPEDSIVSATKRKLKNHYPSTGLKLLGKLGESELIDNMCNADIFVQPSYIENSSNSLSEAMLLGMPCIATYVGGTMSLISNGINGLLIQEGEPWGLAGAIKLLMKDKTMTNMLSENAYAEAKVRHDSDKITNELFKIYSDIIEWSK